METYLLSRHKPDNIQACCCLESDNVHVGLTDGNSCSTILEAPRKLFRVNLTLPLRCFQIIHPISTCVLDRGEVTAISSCTIVVAIFQCRRSLSIRYTTHHITLYDELACGRRGCLHNPRISLDIDAHR